MPSRDVASTAARLAEIVEAAERAAAKVIDDAEAQAAERLREAEAEAGRLVSNRLGSLSELTDSLVTEAEELRTRSQRLLASLEQAQALLAGAEPERGAARAEGEARGAHLSAVAPVEEERSPQPHAAGGGAGTPAGARLLATQMAVSGSSREEIESRLRSGFEVEDAGSILDAILGPED
jgi:hypothetical protein